MPSFLRVMNLGQTIYSVSMDWKIAYGLLSFFSMLCSLVIPVVYYFSKKSRHHPAIILVLICIFEMISCYHLMIWAMDLDNFLQFFRVYGLVQLWEMKWSQLDFSPDVQSTLPQYIIDDNIYYCYMNYVVYFSALFLEFGYYIVLCIDLIITLKWPFISGRQRILWYNICVLSGATLLLSWCMVHIQKNCDEQANTPIEPKSQPQLTIANPPVIVTEIIFLLVGLISIGMAIQTLCRHRKTDSELYAAKNQYLLNHCFFITVIYCIWMVPFYNNVANRNLRIETLNNISFCILLSQGIFLGLLRLSEPFFRLRIKIFIKTLLMSVTFEEKRLIESLENQDNSEEDVWNFSLATLVGRAQNQEVVSHILRGILQITQYQNNQSVIDSNLNWFPNLNVIKPWCMEQKKKNFDSSMSIVDNNTENVKEPLINKDFQDIAVHEYAPKVFQILRNADGITADVFAKSLNIPKNSQQIKSAQQSLGKSGSFFFFSHDKKLILKTITGPELKILLKKFLNPYVTHLTKNPESLIARVYGAYTIRIAGVAPINLIMMENTVGQCDFLGGVKRMYDLKGSLINRFVRLKTPTQLMQQRSTPHMPTSKRPSLQNHSPTASQLQDDSMTHEMNHSSDGQPRAKVRVLKDINFLESEDLFLELEHQEKDSILDQMKADTDFLYGLNIMDYSLLLGIAEPTSEELNGFQYQGNSRRAVKGQNGCVYSIAIIDYLQIFNLSKQLEYRYKTIIKQKSKDLISCILPKEYQTRFNAFMNQIMLSVHYYDS